MKKLILIFAIIPFVFFAQTQIRENQIKDNAITRDKLNSDTTGRSVIKKVITMNPILNTYTGADSGTGDVTISFDSDYIPYYLLYGQHDDDRMDSLRTFIIDTTSLSNRIVNRLSLDSIPATNNYIPKISTTKKLVNSLIFDNGTNAGIGTILPRSKFTITGDPTNTSQPTGIYDASGDLHTGLFINGNGNALNEKYGIQLGNYVGYGFAGMYSIMTSSGGVTVGDLTFDLRAGASDLTLTERMRITSTGQVYFGTTSGGSKVSVSGGVVTDSIFISTIAGTSPPLIVTSDKQVTNLNADRLDSLHSTDFCRWLGASDNAPTASRNGDIYYDNTLTAIYIYYNSVWFKLSP
ncbi:MAG: hypothetical protein AB9882_02650 [Ignavibacteriaceae bacterium]